MGLILNDWKHLLRTETSQKSLLKIFCYNNKVTRKVKDFQKLSNKEIYLSLQSNSAKYNKPFKFISWPNFLEGHHILSQESFDGYIFSVWYKLIHFSLPLNPAIHRMGNAAKILCPSPDVENKKSLNPIFILLQALQNYSSLHPVN